MPCGHGSWGPYDDLLARRWRGTCNCQARFLGSGSPGGWAYLATLAPDDVQSSCTMATRARPSSRSLLFGVLTWSPLPTRARPRGGGMVTTSRLKPRPTPSLVPILDRVPQRHPSTSAMSTMGHDGLGTIIFATKCCWADTMGSRRAASLMAVSVFA